MKKIFYIILLLCNVRLAYAQPSNDAICSATPLSVNGGCTGGTNVSSTNAGTPANPACWGTTPSNDVWFSFVATSTTMTVSTDYVGDGSGDLTNTQIAVYSSSNNTCSGALTSVGCNDNGGATGSVPLNSVVNLTGLTVNNTYFIRVDGSSTATGDFCIGAFTTPSVSELTGSTCAYATQVYPNNLACSNANGNSSYNYTGNWTNLVGTNYCGCDNETSQHGAWSTFTANATTTTISDLTAGANQTAQDITVFTGGCASLSCVSCYSMAKGGSQAIATTVGTQYWILSTLPSADASNFRPDLCFTSTVTCTPPTNNNCATATSITANTVYSATTYCATADDALCSGSTENNIWYSWTVPATWSGNTYFQLYNQNCLFGTQSSGSQVSIYTANSTCATTSGCVVYANTADYQDVTIGWTPTPGASYLINYDGNGGEVCTMNFTIQNVVVPLPIELISFTAQPVDGKYVSLSWNTASETGNDYFTIERSIDGVSFEQIAIVDGAGNSTSTSDYSTRDNTPIKGTSYYRLKQTDYDGNFTYSEMRSVVIDQQTDLGCIIFPNPSSPGSDLLVQFSGPINQKLNIEVFDVAGRVIISKTSNLYSNGGSQFILNNLDTPGMYFLKASTQDGQTITKKIVVKD